MSLQLVPVTLRDAHAFVARWHRHHRPSHGGKFAVAAGIELEVVAVAVVGRPIARMLDDGWTCEVTRLCCREGAHNAASMLYAACWRAARALGYRRCITYTLATEKGVTLRAAGWQLVGECGGGKWSRAERPRVDTHPTQAKLRWEAPPASEGAA